VGVIVDVGDMQPFILQGASPVFGSVVVAFMYSQIKFPKR